MVCVDTDFIAGLQRGNEAAMSKIKKMEESSEVIYTTAINVAELYDGAHRAKNVQEMIKRVDGLLARFQILPLDYESAKVWGELAHNLRSNPIGELDLFIASIVLSNRQTLITRNIKHFERVPRLQVEGW